MKKTFFLMLLFTANLSIAQDSLMVAQKKQPIIFGEAYIGAGGAVSAGWNLGATLNYQFFKRDLITARIGAFSSYTSEYALLAPTVAIPFAKRTEKIVDYGLLYGKRWISGGFSFSASAGVATIQHEYLEKIGEDYYAREERLFGVPYELNFKFFKKQKRRYRAYYGIIPVTKKKVAFGRNIGFKLSGTISKANYCAFGISFGLGVHKKY